MIEYHSNYAKNDSLLRCLVIECACVCVLQNLRPHLRYHRAQRLGRRSLPLPVGPVALHGVCQSGVQEEGDRDLRDEARATRCQAQALSQRSDNQHLSWTGSCEIRRYDSLLLDCSSLDSSSLQPMFIAF